MCELAREDSCNDDDLDVDKEKAKLVMKELPEKDIELLNFVPLDISSTGIRKCLKTRKSVVPQVPKKVLNYISKNKLYS